MKQLIVAFRTWLLFLAQLFQNSKELDKNNYKNSDEPGEQRETLKEKDFDYKQHKKQIFKRIIQNLRLENRQRPTQQPFKKASLFLDGKTNTAALSLVWRGVAEILSQKMDLAWKTEESGTLSYEKKVTDGKGKICYYVTDNPESPQPEIMAEEAALAVIDQFDPRACAIHLIYCALVANLEQPWAGTFVINDKQLLEYTGLNKRRDLSKHEKLSTLYHLARQPAQVIASIAWSKQENIGDFSVADIQIWDVAIIRDFHFEDNGDRKLIGLKIIGKPGAWTRYFLNSSEYYRHTGIITKKTVQKLFSIGKQNVGAARLLIWLTFQIQPGLQNRLDGQTLIEIAYGREKIALGWQNRQLRRQLADDFETDLKVVKAAGWQVEIETAPAWLTTNDGNKRPIGFWDELLNSRWSFNLPIEVQECLMPQSKPQVNIEKSYVQPPSGKMIREARKAKGLSRADLAKIMGKSISWVDAIETSHRQVAQKDLSVLLNVLELNE